MRGSSRWAGVVVGVLLVAGLVTGCQVPNGLHVTSTVDAPDASVGDGICASAAGECTLRAAVQEANARHRLVQIDLATAETYSVDLPGGVEDAAATGDLDITGRVTIEGHGSTIDASGDRVLHVTASGALTLHEVTVTGGVAEFGAGLRVDTGGSASISASRITGNFTFGTKVCTSLYDLPEVACSDENGPPPAFSSSTEGGGAGIWKPGTLAVWDSTIDANKVQNGSPGCYHPLGLPLPNFCTFSRGGGVLNYGTASFVNVTISGNQAINANGAALVDAQSGHSTLLFVTIMGNQQQGSGGSLNVFGERIFNTVPDAFYGEATTLNSSFSGPAMRMAGTVIDGPPSGDPYIHLCAGRSAFESLGDNVVADDSCFGAGALPTDQVGVLSGLGPLGANGGPTPTHLPSAGSPLIDAILATAPACSGLLHVDQRGVARLAGHPCTVGSVEVTPDS